MERFKTLRVRFALWVALLVMSALVLFGAFVYWSLARNLETAMDDSLRLSATQAMAAVNYENGQINFGDALPEKADASPLTARGLAIRILNLQGVLLGGFGDYRHVPLPPETFATTPSEPLFSTLPDTRNQNLLRIYSAPIVEEGQPVGIIQVAHSSASVQETLNQLLRALVIGGVALMALAAGGGYFLAARALAPIDRMTQTARRISAQDLSARLNLPATDDEVGRLASTLDLMLERLEASIQRERQFATDASHDLRTPLAAIQAILDVTRAQPRSAAEYERALDDLEFETQRLNTLTENLLQLARGEARLDLAREPIDAALLLKDVCASMQPLAQAKGLTLRCEIESALRLRGDSDELARMFVNLLENAMKYTERGGVTVTARADGKSIRIQIQDTGRGISAEHLPHIFDRFYRADASRSTEGTGLGLAIAREIARAHGGNIQARSVEGKGATFVVSLPRAPNS
jgi:heavy metal sensor kinase